MEAESPSCQISTLNLYRNSQYRVCMMDRVRPKGLGDFMTGFLSQFRAVFVPVASVGVLIGAISF